MDRPTMPTRVWAAAAAIVCVAAFWVVDGYAGDWKLSPSVAVSETFTDNVSLATGQQDRDSDLITTVAPGFQLLGRGGRASLNLNYNLIRNLYRKDSERNNSNNNLLGVGQVELWDHRLFIDAQSSISRQINATGAASTGSAAGQDSNRSTVRVLNVSPFFRHHFGTWVNTESRLTMNQVSAGGSAQNTSTTRETFFASSGRRFTQMQWSLSLDSSKTKNEGDTPDRKDRHANVNLNYIISPALSLIASVGHEKVDDSTLTNSPSGMTWNLGFATRPSPRTSFRMTYGTQNQASTLNMQASHRLSARTSLSASYSDTLQTSQQLVSNVLGFLVTDPSTGILFDTRTLLPYVPSDSDFGLQDTTFRQQVFQIGINGSRRRNSFNGSLNWEKRDTEATGVIETVVGGNVGLTRQMSRRGSGTVGLRYRTTDFGTPDQRQDDEITASLSYRYEIFKDIVGSLTYNLTRRTSTNSDQDLRENAVSIRLNKRF